MFERGGRGARQESHHFLFVRQRPTQIRVRSYSTAVTGRSCYTAFFRERRLFPAFARFRFHLASSFNSSFFETVNILRTALSNFSASVFPGTSGAGSGFTPNMLRRAGRGA